jgi:hypothetical protein
VDRTCTHTRILAFRAFISVACAISAAAVIFSSSAFCPATADTPSSCVLKWATIDTPGSYPQRCDIQSPCEINAMAVSPDGKTIYALDIPDASTGPLVLPGIYRSEDGGISWSQRPTQWLAKIPAPPAPIFPIALVAMAPDNASFIAVACMDAAGTHRREVYYSEDGGTNWNYSGAIPYKYSPSEQVGSLAISPPYFYQGAHVHDIIAGTRDPNSAPAQGDLYILRYPGIASWTAQNFGGGDIIALQPSPAYSTDESIVLMSSTLQRTYINISTRDLAANASYFNIYPNWPVELCEPAQAGGTGSGKDRIITGSISLPSDFSGGSPQGRIIFAAYDSNGQSQGMGQPLEDAYRLNDSIVTRLRVPSNRPRICSLAYHGTLKSGKLLAGCVTADPLNGTATAWFAANPLDRCVTWTRPLKPPTGGFGTGFANSIVAWANKGDIAFTATGTGNRDTPLKWSDPTGASWAARALDESALSISSDNGISWNQLSLIDTRINRFRSLAVALDGKTVYISSVNDAGLDSTWRSRTEITGQSWERIACLDCPAPLLRLAPDRKDGASVFLGSQGSTRLIQSRDLGQIWNDCLPGALLQDMAARSSDELFVLQANALVRRGAYEKAGWIWDKFTDTCLLSAHTITVLGNYVAAGAAMGQQCPASYSLDGGKDWTLITEPAYSTGNKHVALDLEFKDNHLLYLADDAGGIYRWAVGSSDRWDDMTPPANSFYGMAAADDGVMYAAYSPLTTRGVDRTTYSRGGIPKLGIFWDSLTAGLSPAGIAFRLEPNCLVYADETIWAFDSRDYNPIAGVGRLWAFHDTLAYHSPWLLSPKANSLVYCDPVTGRNAQVDLRWEQLSLAEAYEIEIGKDKWFDLVVTDAAPATNPFFVPNDLLYPAYYIGPGMLPEAGHTYYWHVRVKRAATGQVIRSRWSYAMSFTVRNGLPVAAPAYPGIGSLQPCHDACDVPAYPLSFSWTPMQGASSYRFVLSRDPDLGRTIVDQAVGTPAFKLPWRLDYSTSYFWQVTPLEPVPGDPSPVFTFTTQDEKPKQATPPHLPDNTTNALLVALILSFLIWALVQAFIYRNRRQ